MRSSLVTPFQRSSAVVAKLPRDRTTAPCGLALALQRRIRASCRTEVAMDIEVHGLSTPAGGNVAARR